MNYVFDTNIVLFYLKNDAIKAEIEERFAPFAEGNSVIVSVATVAEIQSIALQRKWGKSRLAAFADFFETTVIVEVRYDALVKLYAQIDAFSQGKISSEDGQQLGTSARNMGKNDLWIAATAALTDAVLLTSDQDFTHLDEVFITVELIER